MKDLRRYILTGEHVCPWWLAYSFDNVLRRWAHKPERLLGPYVRPGMSVLDVGCGMGHFSLGMARMVGEGGSVESVDLQPQMLEILSARASDQGLSDRIRLHPGEVHGLPSESTFDFILTFWMAHEVPGLQSFMDELYCRLKQGGRYFLAEPRIHVSRERFRQIADAPVKAGFIPCETPSIRFSRAVVFSLEK